MEETKEYRIDIEKRQIDAGNESDLRLSLVVAERKEHYYRKTSPIKNPIFFGEFTLDVNLRRLYWKKEDPLHLSYREVKILEELIENKGHIVSRDFLLRIYWGEISYYKSRSLDVLISRLRKYLRTDPSVEIVNYRSEGLQIIY
jgi:DNA-binding response OmpR family regulator